MSNRELTGALPVSSLDNLENELKTFLTFTADARLVLSSQQGNCTRVRPSALGALS